MNDQIIIAAIIIAGLGMVALAALQGWQGWLTLKERELERLTVRSGGNARGIADHTISGPAAASMARIEIADLKERIRKLEAIASGVDL